MYHRKSRRRIEESNLARLQQSLWSGRPMADKNRELGGGRRRAATDRERGVAGRRAEETWICDDKRRQRGVD
jgi:hypothetical protein